MLGKTGVQEYIVLLSVRCRTPPNIGSGYSFETVVPRPCFLVRRYNLGGSRVDQIVFNLTGRMRSPCLDVTKE